MGIEISTDCNHLCIDAGPFAVVVPNGLVFTDGGREVARVETRYDFSKVPPELQGLALQVLNTRGILCEIGHILHPPPPRPDPPAPEPKRGFWRRLFGR